MFDKLIDFLISIIKLFRFFWVIRQWERGVILRFGKWTGKVLQPGFHFIFPFAVDEVHVTSIIPKVAELEPQTILMKDRVVVVTQALIKYEVTDPKVCLIDVDNEADAVEEFTQGALHTIVAKAEYATVDVKEIERKVKEKAQTEVDKWGIRINSVVIKSFGKMNTIRLMTANNPKLT